MSGVFGYYWLGPIAVKGGKKGVFICSGVGSRGEMRTPVLHITWHVTTLGGCTCVVQSVLNAPSTRVPGCSLGDYSSPNWQFLLNLHLKHVSSVLYTK